jgi:hypothetical protein
VSVKHNLRSVSQTVNDVLVSVVVRSGPGTDSVVNSENWGGYLRVAEEASQWQENESLVTKRGRWLTHRPMSEIASDPKEAAPRLTLKPVLF